MLEIHNIYFFCPKKLLKALKLFIVKSALTCLMVKVLLPLPDAHIKRLNHLLQPLLTACVLLTCC